MTFVKLLAAAVITLTPLTTLRAAEGASTGTLDEAVRSTHLFRTVFRDDVQVKANESTVVLTGTVLDEAHRLVAQETASGVPGVQRVDNQLKVAPPAKSSDQAMRLQLINRLLLARAIGNAVIQVSVKDGDIVLGGEAANLVQKNLAEIYAKEIPGVRQVRNEITVRTKDASYEIDDASLRGMVAFALQTHDSTRDLNLDVSVDEGHVTLEGRVPTTLHRTFISLLAETVRNVQKVTAELETS